MAFILPDLEYDYNALEPYIDAETMKIHYVKHHASYLEKFNAAIKGTDLENQRPADIFAGISRFNATIRNNGGGFFNHSLFWKFFARHFLQDLMLSFLMQLRNILAPWPA